MKKIHPDSIKEAYNEFNKANDETIELLKTQFDLYAETEADKNGILEKLAECYRQREEAIRWMKLLEDIVKS